VIGGILQRVKVDCGRYRRVFDIVRFMRDVGSQLRIVEANLPAQDDPPRE
jgi:hypothetical protein